MRALFFQSHINSEIRSMSVYYTYYLQKKLLKRNFIEYSQMRQTVQFFRRNLLLLEMMRLRCLQSCGNNLLNKKKVFIIDYPYQDESLKMLLAYLLIKFHLLLSQINFNPKNVSIITLTASLISTQHQNVKDNYNNYGVPSTENIC